MHDNPIEKEDYLLTHRQTSYDLLRIFAALAVIMIHVSGGYINNHEIGLTNHLLMVMLNTVSRFSVPCFFMLSGAFVLNNDKNANARYFYGKSIISVGILTVIFTLFYSAYGLAKGALSVINGVPYTLLIPILWDIFRGRSAYHMWYMSVLLVLYLAVPYIVRTRKSISNKALCTSAVVILLLGCLNAYTSTYEIVWSVGNVFNYLGFFLLGCCIKRNVKKTNNAVAAICIVAGLLIGLVAGYLQHVIIWQNATQIDNLLKLNTYHNAFTVVESLLLFYGVVKMRIHRCSVVERVAGYTFFIYLIHIRTQGRAEQLLGALVPQINLTLKVVVTCILTFAISLVVAIFFTSIGRLINEKTNLIQKILKLFKLDEKQPQDESVG